jgi:hypothetical protein
MRKPSERLETVGRGKIKTTMIGAIESIEKYLGYLWNHNGLEERTDNEEEIYQAFSLARQEILDRGHRQMKNLSKEIDSYNIEEKRFKLVIPVNRKED